MCCRRLQDVFNSHTHANYAHKSHAQDRHPWRVPDDKGAPFRLSNIAQLATFVSLTVCCNR